MAPTFECPVLIRKENIHVMSKEVKTGLGVQMITKVCFENMKCLHGIAPEYLSDILTKNAVNGIHSLRDTSADLRLPFKKVC